MAVAMIDSELRRVRRFAMTLHDHRSIEDLRRYERELTAQLKRTLSGTDLLGAALRQFNRRPD
jgi:hypothetical protein